MPLLVKADLYTHIYKEIIEEIVRSTEDGNTIILNALAAGEAEAKAYLNRFDIPTMFTADFSDELLRNKVKDLASWHLIKLANPNIDLALFRTSYEDATKFFMRVSTGDIEPFEWPLKPNDPATNIEDAGHIEWASNVKRNNHY